MIRRHALPRLPEARLSLRAKVMIAVFGGAILPLGVLGLWLASSAQRAGEELLVARLDGALRELTDHIGPRWLQVRSALLDVAEHDAVQQLLGTSMAISLSSTMPTDAAPAMTGLQPWAARLRGPIEVRNRAGAAVWRTDVDRGGAATDEPLLLVSVPVHDRATGSLIGEVHAGVSAAELIPSPAAAAAGAGGVLAAFDPGTRVSLLPLPFDAALFEDARFTWQTEQWLTRYRIMAEPPLALALAAPLSPFTQPFEQAARQGALALVLVSALSFATVALLTRRFTRSLAELAAAAGHVRRGELDRRVAVPADVEIGVVAQAFNTMTASLRDTLDELARRQGLVAVGEFAASLAHEVRNPLSAIRLELQSLEEDAADDHVRESIHRVLRHVQRLDATVAGSLSVARSGRVTHEPLDLRTPIAGAWQAARAEFDERGASLAPLQELPTLPVCGDAAALEQALLNLLLNAAQALESGGTAAVAVDVREDVVEVTVVDSGRGIEPGRLPRVFEPFHSSRPGGTGLGLAIAQRIAHAHGGDLMLESAPGVGTRARLTIPRAAAAVPVS